MDKKIDNELRLALIKELVLCTSMDSIIMNFNYRLRGAGYTGIQEVVNWVMDDE